MSNSNDLHVSGRRGGGAVVGVVLVLWLALMTVLAYTGVLRNEPGEPPLPLVVALAVPILIFFALYAGSGAFRDFVLSRDLRLLTMLQAWRVLGAMFLVLYFYDILPGLFAYPAGLGDVAIGVTAPTVAMALIARPDFAASRAFVVWNLLGLFDFVVAFATGTLTSGVIPGLVADGLTSSAVVVLPLALIPGFLVPVFSLLHIAALLQARQAAAGSQAVTTGAPA